MTRANTPRHRNSGGTQAAYQVITDRILEELAKGTVPWRKPWQGEPMNLVSGKVYRGINYMLLSCVGSSPFWLSFRQAKELGGSVKKGAKSTPAVFWKRIRVKDKDSEEEKEIPLLRYYRVFNLDQCEGVRIPKGREESVRNRQHDPLESAETVIGGMPNPPRITHSEPRAYYSPAEDRVNLPKPELFESAHGYYSTAFHELGHSTGHEWRLNRDGITEIAAFGSHTYSREELVAEMTAAFLCGHCGIDSTIKNSAAYIDGWRRKITSDPRLVVTAGAQAQRAADFILNRSFGE